MKIISLGWGVQSFTLAAMVALGELEPVDAAIHADTMHERSATYEFAARWTPWLEQRGVKVVTVMNPTGGFFEVLKKIGQTHIPAFTLNARGDMGQLNRSCTHRWKIVPMRRWITAQLNGAKKIPGSVEQWIGISLDEVERMKPSDVKYITNRWPLIEKKMTRNNCAAWLSEHGIEIPPKSSCTFCPFHNLQAWYNMKEQDGQDWQEAVKADDILRNLRPPYDLFVYFGRVPLSEIKSPQDNGQLDLFTSEECSGVCFV